MKKEKSSRKEKGVEATTRLKNGNNENTREKKWWRRVGEREREKWMVYIRSGGREKEIGERYIGGDIPSVNFDFSRTREVAVCLDDRK